MEREETAPSLCKILPCDDCDVDAASRRFLAMFPSNDGDSVLPHAQVNGDDEFGSSSDRPSKAVLVCVELLVPHSLQNIAEHVVCLLWPFELPIPSSGMIDHASGNLVFDSLQSISHNNFQAGRRTRQSIQARPVDVKFLSSLEGDHLSIDLAKTEL